MVLIPRSSTEIVDPLPVEIDAPIPVPTSITGQPITVTQSVSPLPVIIPTPVPVTQTVSPLPVIIPTPVPVTQTVSPLPVDICPVSCDVPVINGSVSPLLVTTTPIPIGTPVGETIANETNLPILANTDIFGADLSPIGTVVGDSVIFRLLFSALLGGKIEITLNGADFVFINGGDATKDNTLELFDIVVDNGDLFNIQYEKATTVTFLRVVQLI